MEKEQFKVNYLLDDSDESIEKYLIINDEYYLLYAETEKHRIYRNIKGDVFYKDKKDKNEK